MDWKKILKTAFFILFFAVYWESISREFWDYSATIQEITVFRTFPIIMIAFWMAVFSVSLCISEYLFKKIFHAGTIPVFDKKLYILEIFTFGIVGMAFEALLGVLGLLEYNQVLRWTIVPLINIPINSVAGYFGIGMFVPSTLRVFRGDGRI